MPRTGRPRSDESKDVALYVRCKQRWRAWVNRFGEAEGTSATEVVEEALKVYARLRKFEDPPRR